MLISGVQIFRQTSQSRFPGSLWGCQGAADKAGAAPGALGRAGNAAECAPSSGCEGHFSGTEGHHSKRGHQGRQGLGEG